MKALAGSIRRAAKVWLIATVVVVVALALGQESRPASASNTEILVSFSSTSPIAESSIVLYPDGPPVVLYIWAKKVESTLGAGQFQLEFNYDSSLLSVTSLTVPDPLTHWLGSTGRSVGCYGPFIDSFPDPGWAQVSCDTIGAPPPWGPSCSNGHCDGLLATLTLQPGSVAGNSILDFAIPNSNPLWTYHTTLNDTGQVVSGTVIPPAEIPATVPTPSVIIVRCADFNNPPDGVVDLFNDIIGVIQRFGMTSDDPAWQPVYDLDGSGNIDLFNDIVGTIMQFDMECTQTVPWQ